MKTIFKKINYDSKGKPVSIDIYEEYTVQEFNDKFKDMLHLYIPKYPYPMIIND